VCRAIVGFGEVTSRSPDIRDVVLGLPFSCGFESYLRSHSFSRLRIFHAVFRAVHSIRKAICTILAVRFTHIDGILESAHLRLDMGCHRRDNASPELRLMGPWGACPSHSRSKISRLRYFT